MASKYTTLPVQAKASIWYTICNFLQKGLTFIVMPIYVRLLSTAEYGEWSVFQSWAGILIIFASLNLSAGVYTKALVDIPDSRERDRYTASMQGLGTVSSIGMFIIHMLFRVRLNELMGIDTLLLTLLYIYFIMYPAFSFWCTRQRVEYKYKSMNIVTVIVSILTPSVSILLLKCSELRSKALIIAFLLSQIMVGSVFYGLHFIKGRCFYDKKYWIYALRFNIPLIPHYLSLIILGQADRIMIKFFCGSSDAGIYSFAYQIGSSIIVFLSAVNGAKVPWAYEQLHNKVYTRLRSISNILCIIVGVITIIITFFAPDIIMILGTKKYETAKFIIPIVALSIYFTFVYDMFCTVEFYYGATRFVMLASLIGAVSNVILNWILIPVYGLFAAAYTTLISYLLFVFMHYFYMHKVMEKECINVEIYDIKFIIFFSLLLSSIIFVGLLTYKHNYIRYGFIGILIFLVLLTKSIIKKHLKF